LLVERILELYGVRPGLNACVLCAILAQPFIPDAAKVVLDALGVSEDKRGWPKVDDRSVWDALARGHKFTPPDVLFKKIEDEQVADFATRFGGAGAS
jgi:methionyl-tRNA synthetase